jgi:predicted ATP-grasp superfamily ATP-dependent carboligase
MPGICLPFADAATFHAISDKRRVLAAAAELGLAVPDQRVLECREDATLLDASELRFPLVLKPSRSVGGDDARVKLSVRHARDAAALRAALEELPPEAYPLLLQQRIEGPGTGVFLLLWDDEVRAVFAHRRLREKPPAGGVGVRCESVAAAPALVSDAVALLRHFGWRGVAMVEFKVDGASGTPYLMEVNGRFWGSLQLAIDAGVDFPALLLASALGEPQPPVVSYRIGLRSHWWLGEVDHVIARLRRGDAALHLPAGAPSRVRALSELFTSWRPGQSHDTFRRDDPRPFFRELRQWVAAL